MARFYAKKHFKTDPGTRSIYFLPAGAPEREIRLVEVNELIVERTTDPLEPIDFGVDIDSPKAHTLMVLDITPSQWEKIRKQKLSLPNGWSLDGAIHFSRQ